MINGGPLDPFDPQQFSGCCEVPIDVVGGNSMLWRHGVEGACQGLVYCGGREWAARRAGGEWWGDGETDETTKSGHVGCRDSEDPTVVIITDFGVWPLAVRHKSSVPVPGVSRVDLKVAFLVMGYGGAAGWIT